MAGTINKKKMFENVRPDLRGLTLMSKLAIFHDDESCERSPENFKGREFTLSVPLNICGTAGSPGNLTRRKPNQEEREDVEFGWKIAKELGRLDIGQCVVVRRKTVLAMEAIEGTNETILRGGKLARKRRLW